MLLLGEEGTPVGAVLIGSKHQRISDGIRAAPAPAPAAPGGGERRDLGDGERRDLGGGERRDLAASAAALALVASRPEEGCSLQTLLRAKKSWNRNWEL